MHLVAHRRRERGWLYFNLGCSTPGSSDQRHGCGADRTARIFTAPEFGEPSSMMSHRRWRAARPRVAPRVIERHGRLRHCSTRRHDKVFDHVGIRRVGSRSPTRGCSLALEQSPRRPRTVHSAISPRDVMGARAAACAKGPLAMAGLYEDVDCPRVLRVGQGGVDDRRAGTNGNIVPTLRRRTRRAARWPADARTAARQVSGRILGRVNGSNILPACVVLPRRCTTR